MSRGRVLYCIDLFAGAGGLSTGLSMAGFKTLFANEISESYAETLSNSHKETFVETGDIRCLDASRIRRSLQIERGELHLLAGGPPCQGFSVNAPVRSTDDTRNHLFRDFLRFAEEFLPKAILIENVPGMLSFEKGATVLDIMEALRRMGYRTEVRILFAAHYGVPQMRWRTIILANRMGIDPLMMFPLPSHHASGRANFTTRLLGEKVTVDPDEVKMTASQSFVTVGEAIFDLPEIENGKGVQGVKYKTKAQNPFQQLLRRSSRMVRNHHCAALGPANLERLPHIPQGGSWRDIPFDLLPAGMKRARRSDHTKRYGRLHPDQLGSTILTKCDPHWGTYIHPTQERVLSVREAARIQSFPDDVTFAGSVTQQYEQVGNAVPPVFAKALGERIRQVLFSSEESSFLQHKSDDSVWLERKRPLAV
ncbi:DNA cytosine methyltransferase [Ruegeria atlantica]|uniref:DNA cytosine methyltransferase n=1 Tax=Ruegeria atlantica TaxID=81569 RepID=UPI00147B08CE|nr:DNA cytosine methyltransferase [Ruegeria atlantica]